MKTFLLTLYILTASTIVFAQNWSDESLFNSQQPVVEENPLVSFSIEMTPDNAQLATEALCYSTGTMDNCNEDKAKSVVKEFIQEKVDQFIKSQVNTINLNIQ